MILRNGGGKRELMGLKYRIRIHQWKHDRSVTDHLLTLSAAGRVPDMLKALPVTSGSDVKVYIKRKAMSVKARHRFYSRGEQRLEIHKTMDKIHYQKVGISRRRCNIRPDTTQVWSEITARLWQSVSSKFWVTELDKLNSPWTQSLSFCFYGRGVALNVET